MENISQHIISVFEKIDIKCSDKKNEQQNIGVHFLSYNNTDNSIRWIYAANSKQALMLKFYGIIGWKSKVFSLIVKILFALGLSKLLSRQEEELFFDSINFEKYRTQLGNEWALFTGTPGKLRKALIYISKQNENVFLKIPLTSAAKEIVEHEANVLIQLNQFSFSNTKIPIAKAFPNYLQQSDLSIECSGRSNSWTMAHNLSSLEIFSKTKQVCKLSETDFWKKIERNFAELQTLPAHSAISTWDSTIEKLVQLKASIDSQKTISTSVAHTDLTPWNCYANSTTLFVYDWELAINDAPALYDLFHFHLQGNCLLGNQPFETVDLKLNTTLQSDFINKFIKENSIDTILLLKLYLLYHISTSMCWYGVQPELHAQVHWLMKLWNDYLTKNLSEK